MTLKLNTNLNYTRVLFLKSLQFFIDYSDDESDIDDDLLQEVRKDAHQGEGGAGGYGNDPYGNNPNNMPMGSNDGMGSDWRHNR